MNIPLYQFEIVRYIYKHPYISYADLCTYFQKRIRFVPYYPFHSTRKYNETLFTQAVDSLKSHGYVCYNCFKSFEEDNGIIYLNETVNSFTDPAGFHLRVSASGAAFYDTWYHDKVMFWVPWLVTTLITLIGLVFQVLNFCIENGFISPP